jgi:hypothetical protein
MGIPGANLNRLPAFGFEANLGCYGLSRIYEKRAIGLYSLYYSVLVVRGIGYRILYSRGELLENFQLAEQAWRSQTVIPENWNKAGVRLRKKSGADALLSQPLSQIGQLLQLGASYSRILLLCMGHAHDAPVALLNSTALRQYKKNRKLVFYNITGDFLHSWVHSIFKYRPPSVYTGRGIRRKKKRQRRKLGKKDARKGRIF